MNSLAVLLIVIGACIQSGSAQNWNAPVVETWRFSRPGSRDATATRCGYDFGESSGTTNGYVNVDPGNEGAAPTPYDLSPYVPSSYRPSPVVDRPSQYGPSSYEPSPIVDGPYHYIPSSYRPSSYGPSHYGPSSYEPSAIVDGPSHYGPSPYGPSSYRPSSVVVRPSHYGPSSYGPSPIVDGPSHYGPSPYGPSVYAQYNQQAPQNPAIVYAVPGAH